MRKTFIILSVLLFYAIIHEGTHALFALIFNEYKNFTINYYGLEVIFKTPVIKRQGIEWGIISGGSNIITIIFGYLLFYKKNWFSNLKSRSIKSFAYWLTVIFLLFDALNLSIVPLFFGGDIGGVVEGFGVNRYIVQFLFFIIFLVNRELIIKKLFPLYGVKQTNILWRPLLNREH